MTHREGEPVAVVVCDALDVTDLVGVMVPTALTSPDTCTTLWTPVVLTTIAWMVNGASTGTSYAVTPVAHGADVTVPVSQMRRESCVGVCSEPKRGSISESQWRYEIPHRRVWEGGPP